MCGNVPLTRTNLHLSPRLLPTHTPALKKGETFVCAKVDGKLPCGGGGGGVLTRVSPACLCVCVCVDACDVNGDSSILACLHVCGLWVRSCTHTSAL